MIITEAELREAWKNGRGSLPEFPHGTRFTPAARDFITSLGAVCGDSRSGQAGEACTAAMKPVSGDGSMELCAPDAHRLILTSADLDDILAAKPQSLVVHPEVTITDAARERLRNAGIRVLPFVEAHSETPAPVVPGGDDELFAAAKQAVMVRLQGRADEAVVDAVLRRVLASLPPANS
ncbi:MAG TPA: hypothetical protein VMX33_05965 [bacterium]|nr:hypothetical protein [bacterium]